MEAEALACPRGDRGRGSPGAALSYTDDRFAVIYLGSLKYESRAI